MSLRLQTPLQWYETCSMLVLMGSFSRSRKILIPDVPPPTVKAARQALILAGASVLCVTGLAAVILMLATAF